MKKRIIALFCTAALSLMFCFSVSAKTNYPKQTDKFFVNDYASVLSASAENKMYEQGKKLYYACKAQVVAVTVNSLEGEEIEDYSYNLAKSWKLGDKDADNGILLLLSVKERKVRIEVGSGLEGALPDSKTGRILDTYGVDYFSENKFSEGMQSVYNSLINEVYIEYGLEPDADYEPVEDDDGQIWYIVAVFILIFLFNFWSAKKGGGRIHFFPIGFGGGFNSRGSSGGFGGGGGFSGGGGGFSGGGSSRGF